MLDIDDTKERKIEKHNKKGMTRLKKNKRQKILFIFYYLF